MSGWRVQRHYGFGAGHVVLSPSPHLAADGGLTLRDELRDVGEDFPLRVLPLLIVALMMIGSALFVAVSRERAYGDLEVVVIPREVQEPEEIVPPPIQEIVQEEPPPEPEPPKPEPKKIVEKKPEPPPPPKVPEKKPEPVRQIARVQPPKPAPPPPPRPQIDAIKAPVEKTLAPPPPVRRGNRVREAVMPKLDLAPVAPAPELADLPEDGGSRRFAAVRAPTPVARPTADLGPPIAARPLSAPPPEPPPARTRRQAPRGEPSARPDVAPLKFAASAPLPAAPAPSAPGPRSSRPTAPTSSARAAAPKLQPALAAVAPPSARADSSPSTSQRADSRDRTDRNAASRNRSDHSGGRNLAAVPLASLAACFSDREEEALKRRLVAAVTTQSECVSPAGTYRFVETKNLNAFLMTIERAPGRPVADRCAEMAHALDCVAR